MLDSNQNIETTCKPNFNLAELNDVSVKKKQQKLEKPKTEKKQEKLRNKKQMQKTKKKKKKKKPFQGFEILLENITSDFDFLLLINIFLLLTLKCITLAVTSFEGMSRISTALITISVSFYALGLKITYNAFGLFNWGLSK